MIFLSYAREDAGLTAAPDALHRALADQLGDESVFLDRRSIVAGAPWQASIDAALQRARCLVLLVGERWAEVTIPRLSAPDEVLHRELATARAGRIEVLPVFVGAMPRRLDLPDSLRFLDELHWERLAGSPDVAATVSVAQRIVRTAVQGDVRRLTAGRPDPLVKGLAELRDMGPGLRRAVAAAFESISDRSTNETTARELVAVARAAIDRVALEVPARWATARPLRLSVGLDPVRSDPAELREVREVLRPLLSGRGSDPGPLDLELLRVLDVVLSRSLAVRTGDGSRDSKGMMQAKRFLAGQTQQVQRLHRSARRFLVEDLLVGLDEQVRTAVVELKPLDRIRSRPGPGTGRSHVRGRNRRRRR